MATRVGTVIAVAAVALVLFAWPVHALTITGAKIAKGAVQVKGKGATPGAAITWEGDPAGQAKKSGAFSFATGVLPSGCVGHVSDGVATVPAVISSCTPGGGVVVRDANGVLVGPMIDFFGAVTTPTYVHVAYRTGDSSVVLTINANGPVGWSSGTALYYESADCSGPPLIALPSGAPYTPSLAIGTTIYYAAGLAVAHPVGSALNATNGVASCSAASGQHGLAPASTIEIGSPGLVPPFHVEVQ